MTYADYNCFLSSGYIDSLGESTVINPKSLYSKSYRYALFLINHIEIYSIKQQLFLIYLEKLQHRHFVYQ